MQRLHRENQAKSPLSSRRFEIESKRSYSNIFNLQSNLCTQDNDTVIVFTSLCLLDFHRDCRTKMAVHKAGHNLEVGDHRAVHNWVFAVHIPHIHTQRKDIDLEVAHKHFVQVDLMGPVQNSLRLVAQNSGFQETQDADFDCMGLLALEEVLVVLQIVDCM